MKEELKRTQLVYKIEKRLDIEFRKNDVFINNPYQYEDYYDLVDKIGIFYKHELLPYREIYVRTTNPKKEGLGVTSKYFWYRMDATKRDMAYIILKDILTHNGGNLRIKTKIKQYFEEAMDRLRLSDEEVDKILEDLTINKDSIVRLSN